MHATAIFQVKIAVYCLKLAAEL